MTYTWKVDLTDPVLVNLPAGGDLGCNPALPECDLTVYATDNCDGNLSATCTPGAVTEDDCLRSQTFTYYAIDECLNDVSAVVTYTWKVDLTDPVLVNLPAGGDLGCNPALPVCDLTVYATDNCDGILSATCTPGAVTEDGCLRSQTFTYYAIDECLNDVSAAVTYTWKVDLTDPVLVNLPAGGDLGCNPALPECDLNVYATDNCDGNLSATCTPGAVTEDDCLRSQTFTYYAIDECLNDVSAVVTYTWKVDLIDPVLVNLPAGSDLGCNPALPVCDLTVYATDNCDGILSATCTPGAVTEDDCLRSQTFTYYAIDECLNDVSAVVTYTWKVDLTDPVLVNLPAGGDLGCNPALPECDLNVYATDNCDGNLSATCTPGAVTEDDCLRSQTFTYYAIDECLNDVSAVVTYTWKVDLIDPVLVNLPAGAELGCNPALPVCDLNVYATDNCDGNLSATCTPGAVTEDGCLQEPDLHLLRHRRMSERRVRCCDVYLESRPDRPGAGQPACRWRPGMQSCPAGL